MISRPSPDDLKPLHLPDWTPRGKASRTSNAVAAVEDLPEYRRRTLLLTQEEAALLRLSPQTLARYRLDGKGPAFCKYDKEVVYARADLLSWA